MSDEWGPWQLHDGKGCPCRGAFGQFVFADILARYRVEHVLEARAHGDVSERSAWLWENAADVLVIIRYRIRKPRGLTILENLLADLPAPVAPKVDA